MTAETIVADYLKTKPGGCKFKRKYPVSIYTLDFFCCELKLAIEISNDKEEVIVNTERQNMMEAMGIKTLHLSQTELIRQPETALATITKFIHDRC